MSSPSDVASSGTLEILLQFNKIYVLQSLHKNELLTGERLVNTKLKPLLDELGLGLGYYIVRSRKTFFEALSEIQKDCGRADNPIYPIIHLDMHGLSDQSGIALLPSGESVSWVEFAKECQKINTSCCNNLLVASALCHGLHSITAVNIQETAPFLVLVGPEKAVTAGDIDQGFQDFYEELLKNGDLTTAADRLSDDFGIFLATHLLLKAYADYVREECQGSNLDKRVEDMLDKYVLKKQAEGHSVDREQYRPILVESLAPSKESFESHKKRFLLSDHESNLGRFDTVSFEEAMKKAKGPKLRTRSPRSVATGPSSSAPPAAQPSTPRARTGPPPGPCVS